MTQTTIIDRLIRSSDSSLSIIKLSNEDEIHRFSTASALLEIYPNVRIVKIKSEQEFNHMTISPPTATAISSAVSRLTNLKHFFMERCDFSSDADEALSTITSALANNESICGVNFFDCRFGHQGMQAMATHLGRSTTCSLEYLRVVDSDIGNEGAFAAASILIHNTSLMRLYLNRNNIGLEGAEALATAVAQNQSLVLIDLENNSEVIPELEGLFGTVLYNAASIDDVLRSNHTLKYIDPAKDNDAYLSELLGLNKSGPERAVQAKTTRFLNDRPKYLLSIGLLDSWLPSVMARVSKGCRLNTMFELVRNKPFVCLKAGESVLADTASTQDV